MKKLYRLIVVIALFFASSTAKAQIDFGTFLEAGAADANTILGKYLEPAFLGFGYGLNSGWYNTAKPHKLLGFDITPTITMAMVPTDAEFFTINAADYNNISLNSNSPTAQAPTLFGPNLPADELPLLDYTNNGNTISISSPTGLGITESEDPNIPFNAVPSGMVQVGVGLPKNTELKLRIIPTQSDDDFEFGMFGVGFMHDLKQWVPGFKQLPIDVSGFVGWNRINTKIFLDPENAPDQVAEFNTSGFTLQGLVSKKISILTLFAGLGIATTKTDFSLLGDYDTDDIDLPDDPINFDYTSAGPRMNVGMRLKLLILTIHADYAIQKYNTLTVGIGLSVR